VLEYPASERKKENREERSSGQKEREPLRNLLFLKKTGEPIV